MRVGVVGAGIAGLACAQALVARGHAVTLFDKGRRAGGRVASRRATAAGLGTLAFNHGAQYATARGPGFAAVVERLQAGGEVAAWPAAGEGRWVGVPGMSALPTRLAAELAAAGAGLHTGRHVAQLAREGAGWAVRHLAAEGTAPGTLAQGGGEVAALDAVLLALPPVQAAPLLHDAGLAALGDALAPVVVAPCWTLMLGFAERQAGPDVLRLEGDLAWVAREGSRPGATDAPDRWVANAAPAWTRARLEQAPDAVVPQLLALFAAATGVTAAPAYAAAHRWRYALTERPLGQPALWDAEARVGVCGDWCLDGRVEAAWDSGTALAGLVGG